MAIHIHLHDAPELSAREQEAARSVAGLKSKTKKEIFNVWTGTLGRIQNARIEEQRPSWMIYDIIKAKYGAAIADKVA